MSVREIVLGDRPMLRARAKRVSAFGPSLQRLIDDLIDTMRAAPGVGLAAPQVGVSQRVIVIEYAEPLPEDEPSAVATGRAAARPPKLYVVVNPEIAKASDEVVEGVEGCLSIPGYAGNVDRAVAVTVKGLNRRGQPIRLKLRDWIARIFQHEIDHLDGVLFIDRAKQIWRIEPEDEAAAAA